MQVFYLTCLLTSGIISLSQATQCGGSAKYKLTFKGKWTKQSHPQDFPTSNPHFSSVVGCSHNRSYVMWKPGQNATKGVQKVAELGTTTVINKEIDEQISLKTALKKFQGSGITNVETRVVDNVEVNTDYPLVSAISMIAPSPDWFLGVRDFSLCDTTTGKWMEKRERQLPLYDSGTDSGKTFVHKNTPTVPPVPIFLIEKIPEDSTKNETLLPFATFTFEKTFDSTSSNATTTMKPSSKTTPGEASSVQHLGVFVFLKLIILNLFFTNTF